MSKLRKYIKDYFLDIKLGCEYIPSLEKVDEEENPLAVARFYNPAGAGEWFVLAGEPLGKEDYYLFGYVRLLNNELGFFTYNQIKDFTFDEDWTPVGVYDLMD